MPYSLNIVGPADAAAHAAQGSFVKPYLSIEMTGRLETEEMRVIMYETARLVREHALEALLLDMRATTTSVEAGGFFFIVEEAARLRGPRPRAALLARDDQRRDAEYMENSAVNRGLPFRAFFDAGRAMEWLRVTQARETG